MNCEVRKGSDWVLPQWIIDICHMVVSNKPALNKMREPVNEGMCGRDQNRGCSGCRPWCLWTGSSGLEQWERGWWEDSNWCKTLRLWVWLCLVILLTISVLEGGMQVTEVPPIWLLEMPSLWASSFCLWVAGELGRGYCHKGTRQEGVLTFVGYRSHSH